MKGFLTSRLTESCRHLYQAVDLAPAYADFNAAGSAVIIQLGTNSYFTDKQIDSLLSSFSKLMFIW